MKDESRGPSVTDRKRYISNKEGSVQWPSVTDSNINIIRKEKSRDPSVMDMKIYIIWLEKSSDPSVIYVKRNI